MESNTVKTSTLDKITCDICNKQFSSNHSLKRHKVLHTNVKSFICEFCEKSFSRKDTLRDHRTSHLNIKPFSCSECLKSFRCASFLRQHKKRKHFSIQKDVNEFKQKDKLKVKTKRHKKVSKQKKSKKENSDFEVLKSDSQEEKGMTINEELEFTEEKSVCENKKLESENLSVYETYKMKTQHHKRYNIFNVTSITFESHAENLSLFFKNLKLGFYNELFFQLLEKKSYQWYIVVTATLVRSNSDGYTDYIIPNLRSEMVTQYTEDNLLETIEDIFQKSMKRFDEFNAWTFLNVNFLELNMSKI